MTGLELALLTVMSTALLMLIIFTVVCLAALVKALKAIRMAADKVQDSADSAAELVDEVRRTVVNPSIIGMMIEKYLHMGTKKRSKKDE